MQEVTDKCVHDDCFACRDNRCRVLTSASDDCSFYKTNREYELDRIKYEKNLIDRGKYDLWAKYNLK